MQKKNITNVWTVCFLAMICCFLWGSAFPCVKIGYRLFQIESDAVATQILFAGIRFTLAGVLAILIGSIMQKKVLIPQKTSYGILFKVSLFQTILQYFFFYIGLANTTGVKSSIIVASNVFVAILVASLVFKQEKLTGRKLLGCGVGFAGVILINLTGTGLSGGMTLTGEGFIFFSTFAYAVSSVLLKRYSDKEEPVVISGYQFVIGGLVMILGGFVMGGRLTNVTSAGVMMLLYLALVSAVAYSLWATLLKYNPISRVAVFGFMNPVFGVILSAILLKESGQISGVQTIISLILVCIGIYVVNYGKEI